MATPMRSMIMGTQWEIISTECAGYALSNVDMASRSCGIDLSAVTRRSLQSPPAERFLIYPPATTTMYSPPPRRY